VDDNSYNLYVIKEIISVLELRECFKFEIKTAMNGQEALNILMTQDEMTSMHRNKFDLIFLDLHMPILDGF
jgi:CheY-like chemotaxis protein